MTFLIEKHIPEISKRSNCDLRRKYPFPDMEVGDSFLVPMNKYASIRQLASMHGKRMGKRFTTRTVSNGVRVWRIE